MLSLHASRADDRGLAPEFKLATNWLVQGLELETAKSARIAKESDADEGISDDRSINFDSETVNGNDEETQEHMDLVLVLDMATQLTAIYRYQSLGKEAAEELMPSVSKAASAVLEHPELDLRRHDTPSARTRTRRAITVQLSYLLALTESMSRRPPSPELRGRLPLQATVWFRRLIEVAAIDGGTGDKRSDALWPLAIRRLTLAGEKVDPSLQPPKSKEISAESAASPTTAPRRIVVPRKAIHETSSALPHSPPIATDPVLSPVPPSPQRSMVGYFARSLFKRVGSSASLFSLRSDSSQRTAASATPSTRSLMLMNPNFVNTSEPTTSLTAPRFGIRPAAPRSRNRWHSTLTDEYLSSPPQSVGILEHKQSSGLRFSARINRTTVDEVERIKSNLRAYIPGYEEHDAYDSDQDTVQPRVSMDETPRPSRIVRHGRQASTSLADVPESSPPDPVPIPSSSTSPSQSIRPGSHRPFERLQAAVEADELDRIVLTAEETRDESETVTSGRSLKTEVPLARSLKADDLFFAAATSAAALGMKADPRLAAIEDESKVRDREGDRALS